MKNKTDRVLFDTLSRSAEMYPQKTAVVAEGKTFTYQQLLDSAIRLAAFLKKRGMQRGDRVAVYMDNTIPCAISIFGISLAGGVFFVINPQTKADKLSYLLNDSGAFALITDGHLSAVFHEALSSVDTLREIISSGVLPEEDTITVTPFDSIIYDTNLEFLQDTVISLDLAALIYTSGSTGDAKGVMMTHQSMVFTTESLVEYLRLNPDDIILNVLPLAFDYGLYQLLMSVKLGATLVLERSFIYPAQVLNSIFSEGVTVFPGVPTIYMMLITMHKRSSLQLDSVKCITNTAAALPPEITPQLKEIFPNARIYRMYGLTECKRVSYLEPELAEEKPESVGKAIPGTEVFLLDNQGNPVTPGDTGILHVRGAHVMQGYWKKPDLTKKMLRPGNYPGEKILCTHDYFKMDPEGFLYFQGRSDDIIKSRGEKVSPVEIENCLYGIPGIREAAVIGVEDELLGEAVQAFVAVEPDSGLTEKKIRAYCMNNLENFVVPKYVVFLPELPKTASGKIEKKALRAKVVRGDSK